MKEDAEIVWGEDVLEVGGFEGGVKPQTDGQKGEIAESVDKEDVESVVDGAFALVEKGDEQDGANAQGIGRAHV